MYGDISHASAYRRNSERAPQRGLVALITTGVYSNAYNILAANGTTSWHEPNGYRYKSGKNWTSVPVVTAILHSKICRNMPHYSCKRLPIALKISIYVRYERSREVGGSVVRTTIGGLWRQGWTTDDVRSESYKETNGTIVLLTSNRLQDLLVLEQIGLCLEKAYYLFLSHADNPSPAQVCFLPLELHFSGATSCTSSPMRWAGTLSRCNSMMTF